MRNKAKQKAALEASQEEADGDVGVDSEIPEMNSTQPQTIDLSGDHYIVHLQETADGSGPIMQTAFIPAMTGAQLVSGGVGNGVHISTAHMLTTGAGDGTMQPIAIIEAQPLQMSVTGADPNMQDASTSVPTVSLTGAESVANAQVVVASSSDGEHTFVTCPAHLVDYGGPGESDPVLEGTENLLKASEEILHSSSQDE